ncbi:MAG: hypothetical protein SGPRY_013052, partial [Prymnesium sp.]
MTRKQTIFRLAKGYRGRAKNVFRLAINAVEKGLQHAYRSRRLKRRAARTEWIQQMGAGANEYNLSYSKMVYGLKLGDIGVNRKMLALLAKEEPYSFRAIVEECKRNLRTTILEGDPSRPGNKLDGDGGDDGGVIDSADSTSAVAQHASLASSLAAGRTQSPASTSLSIEEASVAGEEETTVADVGEELSAELDMLRLS